MITNQIPNIVRYELRKNQTEFPQVKISTPKESADFIRRFYGDDMCIYESFFILLLNQSNMTIGYAKISQGGINQTVVDIRLIAKIAVDSLACSVIFAHNHPSGNLKPSTPDREMTSRAKNALKLLDIVLVDHIILTETGFCSFADEGIL
ncbi:RadC family protein [Runella sp. SP2]|uniref:JAB domain-containing protein n=1 Tax=Runella sp. SP2 TaxID=2268026 RepID=UPI000F0737CA|nr:JAB domain-containing protein [Runella sp. SP2]AYQ31436.1 DNA repair protein RadC [Runella sp. SP2]